MESQVAAAGGIALEVLEHGAIWCVELATPKANVLDARKCAALSDLFRRAAAEPALKALLIAGRGAHFSFGASVEEHLPEQAAGMLAAFHGMLLALLDGGVPCLAAVRGQCLGGGLELVTLCQRVFAAPDARLGQPEITLGVFAPAASIALPERIGRAAAEELLLSGRSLTADEARSLGLVDELADDPRAAALAYARERLVPQSGSSLRFALRAARAGFAARFRSEIAELERMYLECLMATHDAREGLHAFLEKRPPQWRNA